MVWVVQVRAVVDEQVFDIGEDLVNHLDADVGDDPRVLDDVSQTVLHQLRVTHLTCRNRDI